MSYEEDITPRGEEWVTMKEISNPEFESLPNIICPEIY
jgi:hypothetical protein